MRVESTPDGIRVRPYLASSVLRLATNMAAVPSTRAAEASSRVVWACEPVRGMVPNPGVVTTGVVFEPGAVVFEPGAVVFELAAVVSEPAAVVSTSPGAVVTVVSSGAAVVVVVGAVMSHVGDLKVSVSNDV